MTSGRVPSFLINLDGSADRLAAASARLATLGIAFTRVAAVDGRALRPADHPRYRDAAARATMGRSLVGGEIGCFESHRRALEAFLATGAPHGLVFEDDVDPKAGFPETLDAALAWLAAQPSRRWKALHLGHTRARFVRRLATLPGADVPRDLLEAHYFPMGAFAICWSRDGAREFLARTGSIEAPFDNALQNWLCRAGGGLSVWPPLASVTRAESVIDGTPAWSRPTRGVEGRSRFVGFYKQRRLWKNRLWAIAHRMGLARDA